MRSLLEENAELISCIGVITLRWSLLEQQMAMLLGEFIYDFDNGEAAYYAIGNFSQRVDLLRSILRSQVRKQHHSLFEVWFEKVFRLWKTRNKLVHSAYSYAEWRENGRMRKGWSYTTYDGKGNRKIVAVNKGTFENHAQQLSKRIWQIERFTSAIRSRTIQTHWDHRSSWFAHLSPRAIRHQREYGEFLEWKSKEMLKR